MSDDLPPKPTAAIAQPHSGQWRVPYVRLCRVRRGDQVISGFTCNISVQGVYVTLQPLLQIGDRVWVSFKLPGMDDAVELDALATWRNAKQEHPVHSLPPGCGLRLLSLTRDQIRRIENLITTYAPVLPSRALR